MTSGHQLGNSQVRTAMTFQWRKPGKTLFRRQDDQLHSIEIVYGAESAQDAKNIGIGTDSQKNTFKCSSHHVPVTE